MTLEMRLRDERREAMKESSINNIKNLMANMNIDAVKAMELLGITKEEQQVYLPLLNAGG